MSDDKFDDGLVHSHHWATEKPAIAMHKAAAKKHEDRFDDGLVHGHDWASWPIVRK